MEPEFSISLFDKLPGLVWVSLPDGRAEFLNRRWYEYTGLNPQEAVDTGWQTAVHPDDRARLLEYWERLIASGSAGETEARLRRHDGQYRRFLFSAAPITDASGKVVKWCGINTDIEEQLVVEAELKARTRSKQLQRENEERFRDYAETASDWFWEIGPDYKFTLLTENAFESDAKQRIGTACWDNALDLETEPEKWQLVKSTLEARKPFREFIYCCLGGNGPIYVKASGKPVFSSDGKFLGYRGTSADVTAIICAQASLRESERGFRAALDGIPGFVAILGPDGGVEFVNSQIINYTGQSLEELKNWGTNGTVHHEDLPNVAKIFGEAIGSGIPYQIEMRLRRFDGEFRWFDDRTVPFRDEFGRVLRWYVLLTDIDERKRAEEALRSNERKLGLILNTIPTFIHVLGTDGAVLYVNQAVLDYTGLTTEDVRKEDYRDRLFHPEDLKRVREERLAALKRPVLFELEMRARRNDGSYRWFLNRYSPLLDEHGRLDHWYATSFDIEDRKRAEEALRSTERKLSLILNTIPTFIHVLGADGSILYVNQAVLDYTGLTMEDVRKETYRERLSHPEDLKSALEEREAPLKRPVPFEREIRVRRNDGSYRWFLNRYSPLLDEYGRLDQWYVASFDIEDRKRAEDELKLRVDMIHLLPAAVWSVKPDGTPDIVNQGWHDYTGQTPEYVRSHPSAWMSTMHPDDAEQAGKIYWGGIRSGNGFTMEARFLRASDRTYRWHLNRAVAVRDSAGNITRFVGTSTDVEDLKGAQEELHNTRAILAHMTRVTTMGELTASIAHEVNQPLAGIVTNANTCLRMLAADPIDLDGARATAQRTLRDANRASEVVQRLRAMFMHKKAIAEPLDLNEAAREVLALVSAELQRNLVVVKTEFASDLPPILGDRVQLQQVIMNLVTNAADVMREVEDRQRSLAVSTRSDGAEVRLCVCDSGTGIDPHSVEKLFKAFYSTKDHGMGIGLSVSRSIIQNHGGRLWAAANEGPGATFTFAIPLRPDSGVPPGQSVLRRPDA